MVSGGSSCAWGAFVVVLGLVAWLLGAQDGSEDAHSGFTGTFDNPLWHHQLKGLPTAGLQRRHLNTKHGDLNEHNLKCMFNRERGMFPPSCRH